MTFKIDADQIKTNFLFFFLTVHKDSLLSPSLIHSFLFSRVLNIFFVPEDCWEWRFFFFTFSLLHPPNSRSQHDFFMKVAPDNMSNELLIPIRKTKGKKTSEEILSFSLKLDPSSSSSHSSPSLILSYLAIAISLCSLFTDSFFFTYMKANFEI